MTGLDALIDLSWRIYPAATLMGAGVMLILWGTAMEWQGLRLALSTEPGKIMVFLLGFRLSVIGLALGGIGAAWAWHLAVLLVLSLVIGGEEVLESSVHILMVRRGQRLAVLGSRQRKRERGKDWNRTLVEPLPATNPVEGLG